MAKKQKRLTEEDIEKARGVVKRFGKLSLGSRTSNETLIAIVKTLYPNIRGEEISELRRNQLYRIAERIYHDSHAIVASQDKVQSGILANIALLKATYDLNIRELLEHRICVQLEGNNVSDDHYLSRAYMEAKRAGVPF